MTSGFDRAFIAMGVDADELSHVRGRSILYAGLTIMALAGLGLIAGIVLNFSQSGPV